MGDPLLLGLYLDSITSRDDFLELCLEVLVIVSIGAGGDERTNSLGGSLDILRVMLIGGSGGGTYKVNSIDY